MIKAILRRNHSGLGITGTLKIDPFFSFPIPFKFLFCTTTSSSDFAVSYLINKCGLSPQSALKASKQARFKTSQNPDSVLSFFRNHAFSDTVTNSIIKREPWLLSCDPIQRLSPKFQFLSSIGASSSDIVRIVTGNPRFLQKTLENRIIPNYNLVKSFLRSDEQTLATIISCPTLLSTKMFDDNVKLLLRNGVVSANICRMLRHPAFVLCNSNLEETVLELKTLGFDPSKSFFPRALFAKRGVGKSKWNEKVDTFKSWGWSEEAIMEAFRKCPGCMLVSKDKLDRVLRFWVAQLGWDSSYLVKGSGIFGYSLEKRIVPRAMVVQYLISKGLRSKKASLLSPFYMSEEKFMQNYVICFKEEEASLLLKLYEGNKDC